MSSRGDLTPAPEQLFGDTGTLPAVREPTRWFRHLGSNGPEIFDIYTPIYEGQTYALAIMAIHHDGKKHFGAATNFHLTRPSTPLQSIWWEGAHNATNIYTIWKMFKDAAKAIGYPRSRTLLVGSGRGTPVLLRNGAVPNSGFIAANKDYFDNQDLKVSTRASQLIDVIIPEKQRKGGKFQYYDKAYPPEAEPLNGFGEMAYCSALDVTWYRTTNDGVPQLGSWSKE